MNRPLGLVVGNDACRASAIATLGRRGFCLDQTNDPYQAMQRLCRLGRDFTCVILSLNGLYLEELRMIAAIKTHLPRLEIWLSNTDGRQAALAEAISLGVDGLLAADGLHRIGAGVAHTGQKPAEIVAKPTAPRRIPQAPPAVATLSPNEPILTADELRALLEDLSTAPVAARLR